MHNASCVTMSLNSNSTQAIMFLFILFFLIYSTLELEVVLKCTHAIRIRVNTYQHLHMLNHNFYLLHAVQFLITIPQKHRCGD
jgi:hypothetical protein